MFGWSFLRTSSKRPLSEQTKIVKNESSPLVEGVANLLGILCELEVRKSYDQYSFWIISLLCPNVLYSPFPVLPQIVVTKTVVFRIDCRLQLGSQHSPLRWINHTLKYRVLYPLPMVFTYLCNSTQSGCPIRHISTHIIAHYYHHLYHFTSLYMGDTRQCLLSDNGPSA